MNSRLLCIILLFVSANHAKAQAGLCPPNLDFEMGNFTNWSCRAGSVGLSAGQNTITWNTSGQLPGQHTFISAATAGTDPYGGFPELCPNGSGFSIKLGNNGGGHQAEGISYNYTIPTNLPAFSMIFHYAVVLQDPNHTAEEQPRFRARITDLTTNTTIPCVTFDFTASGSLPGFKKSTLDTSVLYKDWTPITVNLSAYIGKTIQLEFITSDCIYLEHFGYAYVDVNTTCNSAISGSVICLGETGITLTAPYGFQTYEWYTDNTFSTILATTQTLPFDPAPAVGTVFPLIVTPYPGYGCRDTLYATISVSSKPVSNAGPDITGCTAPRVQIGGTSTPGYTYLWTPISQVDHPTLSNPLAWTIPADPEEFIVRTTDVLTGCFSYDTVIVDNSFADTSLQVNGRVVLCNGIPAGLLSVNPAATAVQWHHENTQIPGATSTSYQPVAPGNYWARITHNGCADITRRVLVTDHPLPQVSFFPDHDTLCVTNNSFFFKNNSSVADNSALTYQWKFSDGTRLQSIDAIKVFSLAGGYSAELVATSAFGCRDSISTNVMVMPNGIPDFSRDSVCINRPVLFTNLSHENGSALTRYEWNFNNGGPGSVLKDPFPVMYTTAGKTTVTLELITLGCEAAPQSITRPIEVHIPPPGIRYPDITIPQGHSKYIRARDIGGIGYAWKPQVQLSNYSARHTEFYATTDHPVNYQVDITGRHGCITTDSVLVQVLKKPGFYLPTAFTPDGDGLNDVVKPYLLGMKSLKSFSVFNRWGNLVFHSTRYGEGWDGTCKGKNQDAGVYVWILEFIDPGERKIMEKGTITLIR